MTCRLIFEGWDSFRREVISAGAPAFQIEECRRAYYAGALILFHSIMNILEPGREATDNDMAQMQAINDELNAFGEEIKALVTRMEEREKLRNLTRY